MNRSFIHQHCLNPVRILNSDGSYSYYPCGHCLACSRSRQSSWQFRLELHLKDPSLYGVFITLTYDNKNLPLVHYDDNGNILGLEVSKTRLLPLCTKKIKDSDYFDPVTQRYYRSSRVMLPPGDLDHVSVDSVFKPHFVLHRSGDNYIFDNSNTFAISYLPDVQKFFKRLRFSLSCCPSLALEDNSFSYFVCSEYGPTTYRPHYHGLLFFRSLKTATECINGIIASCWQKQDNTIYSDPDQPIASFVLQESKASSYVSSYVTQPSDLLPLFRYSNFQPFKTSSKNVVIGANAFPLADIPRMLSEDDLLYDKSFFNSETREFVELLLPYPSQCWSRVFPRFLFSRLLDVSTERKCFLRLFEVCKSGEVPDLRDEVELRFGLGKLYHLFHTDFAFVPHSHFDTFQPQDKFEAYELDKDPSLMSFRDGSFGRLSTSFCRVPVRTSCHSHYITPSEIVLGLNWINSHLDLYLFGFNQNLTASRKIIDCMSSVSWCSDPLYYHSLYNRYYTMKFSKSLRSYYDDCLNLPSVTPFDVFNIYISFFSTLPNELSVLTSSQRDRLLRIINLYGFSVSDFYSSDGLLYNFSFVGSPAYEEHLRSLCNRKSKTSKVNKYNHDKFNCK